MRTPSGLRWARAAGTARTSSASSPNGSTSKLGRTQRIQVVPRHGRDPGRQVDHGRFEQRLPVLLPVPGRVQLLEQDALVGGVLIHQIDARPLPSAMI